MTWPPRNKCADEKRAYAEGEEEEGAEEEARAEPLGSTKTEGARGVGGAGAGAPSSGTPSAFCQGSRTSKDIEPGVVKANFKVLRSK